MTMFMLLLELPAGGLKPQVPTSTGLHAPQPQSVDWHLGQSQHGVSGLEGLGA